MNIITIPHLELNTTDIAYIQRMCLVEKVNNVAIYHDHIAIVSPVIDEIQRIAHRLITTGFTFTFTFDVLALKTLYART